MGKLEVSSLPKKEKLPQQPFEYPGDEIDEQKINSFNLPKLIAMLLQSVIPPKQISLHPNDIHVLLHLVLQRYKLTNRPLIEVSGPVTICGDIHGQYSDFLRIFAACGAPSKNKYLFLGNYVDIGRHSLEVVTLLFALHLAAPKNVYLLRGSHEQKSINKEFGFFAEIRAKYRGCGQESELLYNHFNEVFTWMPVAAVVSKRILCVHGGISPVLHSFDDIRRIPLPLVDVKSHTLAFDLLWADPNLAANGFEWKQEKEKKKKATISSVSLYDAMKRNYKMQMRGSTEKGRFGQKEVEKVCKKLDIDLIICGSIVEFGYEFFPGNRLVSICSAARLVGCNYAAMVVVSKTLEVGFVQLKPEEFERQRDEEDGFDEQSAHVSKPRGTSTDKEPVCKRSTKEKHEKEKSKMK